MAEAGLSQRRACRLIPIWRGTLRYVRKPGPRNEENERLRQRLRELADERKRWGYRRLHVLLEREGWQLNIKGCTGSMPRNS
jgi:putative transposase